jgi:hypothetical protein
MFPIASGVDVPHTIRAMTARGGRSVPALILAVLTAVTGVFLFGYAGRAPRPDETADVAAATSVPRPTDALVPPVTSGPFASIEPEPSTPLEPPVTGLVPGSVDRTSLELSATYDVNAELSVASGALDVSTTLVVRNNGDEAIDRLELNTIAARLGRLRVTSASVDEAPVKVRIDDQTLLVPLGGILEPGVAITVRIAYRATLQTGLGGSDWMFTRSGGTIALYRWIPWVSRAVPFQRPNQGDPFVTVSSPEVSVELLTDAPLVLAAPAADVAEFDAGSGKAWAFTVHDVRDVALVLAPDFVVRRETVDGVAVKAYSRSGELGAGLLLGLTAQALADERRLLGVDYPWPALVAAETQGGEAMESPGLVWIPRTLDSLNRTYLVHHEVAHQWFYGLVGNDQRNDPFLDEAAADLLARTVLGSFRSTRCPVAPLDGSIARYQDSCYYEVVYVQGGLLLDDVRARMGANRFWKAMADFVEAHRFQIVETRDLLDALAAAAPDGAALGPLFRSRFPGLY